MQQVLMFFRCRSLMWYVCISRQRYGPVYFLFVLIFSSLLVVIGKLISLTAIVIRVPHRHLFYCTLSLEQQKIKYAKTKHWVRIPFCYTNWKGGARGKGNEWWDQLVFLCFQSICPRLIPSFPCVKFGKRKFCNFVSHFLLFAIIDLLYLCSIAGDLGEAMDDNESWPIYAEEYFCSVKAVPIADLSGAA